MLMQLHSIGDGQFCPEFKGMDPEDVLLHRWRGKDWCVHNFMSIVNHCMWGKFPILISKVKVR